MYRRIFKAVIIGAPGSGKGTISSRIVESFGFKHVSSGDILRHHAAQQTDLGIQANKYMKAGLLVPDRLVEKLILQELFLNRANRCLLDGFPRTRHQAEVLEETTNIHLAINLIVPDEVIVERVASRWVHVPSGRVYNTVFNPPRIPGKDNETGEDLVQRDDDTPEAVCKRLEVYHKTIKPIINFYEELDVLVNFKGTETNQIWPLVYNHLAAVKNPEPLC